MTRSLVLLALAFGLLAPPAPAQTTHIVTLSGMTFSPSALTIEEGDTVRWENASGFHNVNGTLGAYPGNPAGFDSGDPAFPPWSFEFVFSITGEYAYHCEVHGAPGAGMAGGILVLSSTQAGEELPSELNIQSVYPNPFREGTGIEFSLDRPQQVRVAVFDALGREIDVLHDGPLAAGTPVRLEWSPRGEPSGVYVIELRGETFHETRKVIRVR